MPTYQYRCAKCGEDFEVWQSITHDGLARHPGKCRGRVTKVLSPAGIVLKGSGFYRTDNRKSVSEKSSSDDKSSGDKSSGDKSSSDSGSGSTSEADTKKSDSNSSSKSTNDSGTKKSGSSTSK